MNKGDTQLNIVCLETEAFYALVEEVVERVKEKQGIEHRKWINDEAAMDLLNITSKSTLQKLRDMGAIRFTQPMKRVILYDRDSILQYLERHAKDTF